MTCQPYSQLIEMKRWADRDLYDMLDRDGGRLSPEDTALMLRVLDHMHAVDVIFQHHLQGRPHGFTAPRSESMPPLRVLADSAREVGDWYSSYASDLRQADIDQPLDIVFTSGQQLRMTRGEILLHVCLHGTYHRGNAGALLQLRGLTPSREGVTNFLEQAAATA